MGAENDFVKIDIETTSIRVVKETVAGIDTIETVATATVIALEVLPNALARHLQSLLRQWRNLEPPRRHHPRQ
jgi:alpha-D-ribose 1-methylphosphonate 5-phosphate C-P lyase